jgi:hypothetical protein
MLWIFLLGCVLRAPLRPKDLPLTLPLDGFFPAAGPIGGDDRLEGLRYYRYARYKLSLLRILTCVLTWTGGAPACSFRTLASSLIKGNVRTRF